MTNFILAVPTLNPENAEGFVEGYNTQSLQPLKLLILDSHSDAQTRNVFERCGAEILLIEPAEYDHGSTRQLAVDCCAQNVDFIVFMTQDALFADQHSLEKLLSAFDDDNVGAAYGRQLPRKGAEPFETHARIFNYPSESRIKSLADSKDLGIKTCFMSNSFAAYRVPSLRQIGGFPKKNIVSEDTYVAAKLLVAGWKIKYCADAAVYHSHNYTMKQEFQRYFDLGVFHSREPWIRSLFGQPEGDGRKFVISQLTFIKTENVWLIPSALLRSAFKYLGFKLGFYEAYLPNKLKMWLSMQTNYWIK